MDDLSLYNPEGSVLRKAQLKMLEILDVFDAICRKHNINYWLISGTLLGARRHGGFIPWDDDLDVAVLYEDYKRLLPILREELPESLKLHTKETHKDYWYYWAKIKDTKSRVHEKATQHFDFNEQGIFIDIFSLERMPSIKFKQVADKFLLSVNRYKKAKSLYEKIKYTIMVSFFPVVKFLVSLMRLYAKYLSSSKIYSYSYGIFYYSKYNMKYFLPASEIMFEGKKYKAPNNVDGYLTDKYGPNFMDVPKAANRRVHASKIEFF